MTDTTYDCIQLLLLLLRKCYLMPLRTQVKKLRIKVFLRNCTLNTLKVSKVIFSILNLSFNFIFNFLTYILIRTQVSMTLFIIIVDDRQRRVMFLYPNHCHCFLIGEI